MPFLLVTNSFEIKKNIFLFPTCFPLPPVQCEYWQFKCVASGICIDNRRRCDGRPDCAGDGADEIGCDDEGEVKGMIKNSRFLAFFKKNFAH